MITVYLMGGLGNQLFQIFACIAYGLENRFEFVFQHTTTLRVGKERPTYWNNFLHSLKISTSSGLNYNNFPVYKESSFRYNKLPLGHDNLLLHGYFQSYKYFENYYEKILEICEIPNRRREIYEKYKDIYDFSKSISMHFRLGDYKTIQDCHPIMPLSYYNKSLKKIIEKSEKDEWNILCFNEEEDNDIVSDIIENLQSQFPKLHFVRVDTKITDWVSLLIMSLCNHHIIANSSFSWWGAYFNDKADKIVCYPSQWFGQKLSNIDVSDLFKPEWNKIQTYLELK